MQNFEFKYLFGQHQVFGYNRKRHKFLEYFRDLYNSENLGQLHLKSKDCVNNQLVMKEDGLIDDDSDLHKIFYNDIKTNDTFKDLYCNLIIDIFENFFPEEKVMIFQSFPSIRIQYHNSTVIPPHYDSDDLGKHPLGEKNFILPITKMHETSSIHIESEPGQQDFSAINMDYGDLFYFNGNTCTHFNKQNVEQNIRISLDFRVILLKDYISYLKNYNLTYTNPRDPNRKPVKMTVGGYYQYCHKDNLKAISNWHVSKDTILQTRPSFDINEANAVYDYMKGDNFFTEFKHTQELENILANYVGSKYCVIVNNGTVSLMLALMALGIQQGDEVIVPNYTMIASINAIKILGAIPVISDVDADTFTLSADEIIKHVSEKTKAVMHVSLNNRTKNLEEIVSLCKSKNIFLVEDAAQSLGCFLKGKHLGTYGEIGSFSLSTPKIISTGQGGFLVTDSEDLYKKMSMIKNFGRKESGIDDFETFGLNFKFTDIQAIIGIEQMKKLDWRVGRMREIFDLYFANLKGVLKILEPQNQEWIPWFIEIFTEERDELIQFLKHHNIQTRKTYPEINKTNMYYTDGNFVNSSYISNHGLFLPSHTLLTNEEIVFICNMIKIFLKK